jgi:hydroxymethylbilane synthase
VECRSDDADQLAVLAAIDDPVAHRAVIAERAFLAALDGGCTFPVGALATPSGFTGDAGGGGEAAPGGELASGGGPASGELSLEGILASRDGLVVLRRNCRGDDPVELGRRLARDLLDHGGRALDDWAPVGDGGR